MPIRTCVQCNNDFMSSGDATECGCSARAFDVTPTRAGMSFLGNQIDASILKAGGKAAVFDVGQSAEDLISHRFILGRTADGMSTHIQEVHNHG